MHFSCRSGASGWRRFALAAWPTVAVLLAVELLVRGAYFVRRAAVDVVPLPYVAGHAYGPAPPWTDAHRILEEDPVLIWRGRRNVERRYMDIFSPVWEEKERTQLLHQFLPRIPESLAANPVWDVVLNSEGFRDEEFPVRPVPGVVRIVCLGDSWTFGANVGPESTYPSMLAKTLEAAHPGVSFRVFNLGVLGYSSYQGLQLLRTRALQLEPDVVLIGFGMNDGAVSLRDADVALTPETPPSFRKRVVRLLKRSELLRLLHYATEYASWEPRSPGRALRASGTRSESEPVDWEALEPWLRVALPEYRRNLAEMIRLVRSRGASAILLYNELETEGRYLGALREVAAESDAPLIDSSSLIAAERQRVEAEQAVSLGVRPAGSYAVPDDAAGVVFRVRAGTRRMEHGLFIVADHSALGDSRPNVQALFDDGTNGDENAGDGLWSYRARLEPGARVAYVYTNGGAQGVWKGLDVPAIRRVSVPPDAAGRVVYRPIETFGEITLRADSWHTNARGYRLIADDVFDVLDADTGFRRILSDTGTSPG
jgi:lysophospholipase L1-like esterase